jgi:hypothetical protein
MVGTISLVLISPKPVSQLSGGDRSQVRKPIAGNHDLTI